MVIAFDKDNVYLPWLRNFEEHVRDIVAAASVDPAPSSLAMGACIAELADSIIGHMHARSCLTVTDAYVATLAGILNERLAHLRAETNKADAQPADVCDALGCVMQFAALYEQHVHGVRIVAVSARAAKRPHAPDGGTLSTRKRVRRAPRTYEEAHRAHREYLMRKVGHTPVKTTVCPKRARVGLL